MTIKAYLRPACIAVAAAAGLVASGCATFSGDRQGEAPASQPAPRTASRAAHPAKGLSVDMPVGAIAANPAGKTVLQHDLPGLLDRPEYPMFKSMTLKALAGMSNGKITKAKLDKVQKDLQAAAN